MTRYVFLGSTLVLALATAAGAQTPAAGAGQGSTVASSTVDETTPGDPNTTRANGHVARVSAVRDLITAQGCVTREDAVADAAGASAGHGTGNDVYALTNATIHREGPTVKWQPRWTSGVAVGMSAVPMTGMTGALHPFSSVETIYGSQPRGMTGTATAGSEAIGTTGKSTSGAKAGTTRPGRTVILAAGRDVHLEEKLGERVVVSGHVVDDTTAAMPNTSDGSTRNMKVEVRSLRTIGSCGAASR